MTRVLIVDDSPTARELIAEVLSTDPDLEVVGIATNGKEAISMTKKLRPDVLTMDIYMPVLDGLEATREIMASSPTPIVMVSANRVVHDVKWAMKAIEAGALTMLLKPPGPNSPEFESAVKELNDTVKAMAGVRVVRRRAPEKKPAATLELAVSEVPHVLAIAASTGGPPAIQKVLAELSEDFPAPILLVQHIARGFTDGFVAWLDASVPLEVKLACDGEKLKEGVVFVAPEDKHLGASRNGRVLLSSEAPIGGFRPSATYLFESVGNVHKQNAIGVILTGMGNDGAEGLATLRMHGGYVIAQDEESSVVYGMPNVAKQAGVVNVNLPVDHIGKAIVRAM